MTSGWQSHTAPFATNFAGRNGLPFLPGPIEERLKDSLESLPRDDSHNELTKREEMDTSFPDELPPDYGDDGVVSFPGQRTTSPGNTGDLTSLPDLTEDTVLQVVKQRYQQDRIYTCCGEVLISVNPYKQLPIFDEKTHTAYSLGSASSQEPHVFRTAREAISRRNRDGSDQVVLVSGESGAGKTEATKLMLKHILHLSATQKDELYDSIDKVNPLIELFGNARTNLNENSSRFAKFMEVKFSKIGTVTGATIRDYILEKSRVVIPSDGESNFHIFYTFLDDVMAKPERQKQFLMDDMDKKKDFRIVPRSSWHPSNNRLTASQRDDVFTQIGIEPEEVDNLNTVLAAILHLTNIRFVDDDGSSGGVEVDNEDTMNKAAALLCVDPEKLATVLVTTKKTFKGQEILTCKSEAKANETRDAIAKALYERLFGWLIRRINLALNKTQSLGACIGFLDICGFEVLHQNSLEQLCINLANENLQMFMNKDLFEQEMAIYRSEKLDIGHIDPPSNEAILRMFDAPKLGILALINEDTRLEISTEWSMVKKLVDRHAQSSHFRRYKNDQPRFGIEHFAGPVLYSAQDFLEKNGDSLSKEVKDTLVASGNELVSDIFQVQKAPTGSIAPTQFNYRTSQRHDIRFQKPGVTKLSATVVRDLHQSLKQKFGEVPKVEDSDRSRFSKEKTVIDCYQASMKELLDKMGNARPFFVRCIKPNDEQTPDNFDDRKVLRQLQYNGVTEMARIRRLGYPVRIHLNTFLQSYCSLAPGAERVPDKHEASRAILHHCGVEPDQYRIGNTMIFLRDGASRTLGGLKDEEERKKKEEKERKEREEREAEQKRKEAEAQAMLTQRRAVQQKGRESKLLGFETLETLAEVPTPNSSRRTNTTILEHSPSFSSQESMASTSSSETGQQSADNSGQATNKEQLDGSTRGELPESEENTKNNFWDIFRIVARERPTTDIQDMTAMKIIKMIVYVLIFVVVLAAATAQKVSLMLMVSASNGTIPKNVTPDAEVSYCNVYVLTNTTFTSRFLNTKLSIENEQEQKGWCVVGTKPDKERETDRERQRERERDRERQTGRQTDRQTDQERETDRQTEQQTERDKREERSYYILLVIAICIPYILTFLTSMAKVAFGGFTNPSLGTWVWVLMMEALHTFGLTLLVFRILPRLDVVHGLLFLSVVATVPSIIKPIMGVVVSRKKRQTLFITINWILDILAIVGQLSVFPVVFLLHYDETSGKNALNTLDVIGALVFVSLSCWENFMDGRFFVNLADGNPLKNFVLKRRFDLERGRYIPQLITSVMKIGGTIGLAHLYNGNTTLEYRDAFVTLGTLYEDWRAVTAIVVLTLSALVCHYSTYIACKLWMQKISFVIPVTLATPCAILVFFLDKNEKFLSSIVSKGNQDLGVTWPREELSTYWKTLLPGVAWWLALLILTRYVWFPRQSRLAKIEMLFMNPLYCGILTAETLLLNRRRHTLSCRKRRSGTDQVYYCLSSKELRATDDGDYGGNDDGPYAEINDENRDASSDSLDNLEAAYGGRKMKDGEEEIPLIYACATMWHEVKREMIALLKSLHRLDQEQWLRKQAQELSKTKDKDYFEYEAHVFFDDAMTLDDDEEVVANGFVKEVVEVMEQAVSSVWKKTMHVKDPIKIPTPYGGQLLWVMPGGNLLFIHLKDKAKIRHRKRWSQVMYMYYLLGFRLTRQCEEQIIQAIKSGKTAQFASWGGGGGGADVFGSDVFEMLSDSVAKKSQNTFVMALDGDTDFSPGAVHILLDRMKKNPKVGAACGRIHPIGSGPMVWYQMFEYAVGHWMQKATEHVLGCVLCSPGCFSLFRGSALMDDNVMRMYTILPSEPGHYLQYDQGEDRWLCTLLLQQGYRVDYAAAADAWTYAPEGFNEFFNQRRRWMPSTLANVMDLLADYANTVAVNSNISMLYIVYQVALMISTIIGPGTVLMMISGAIGVVFKVGLLWSYVISLVPAIAFLFVCLYCKSHIQLYMAALMSTFYAFVMMIVFVGTIVTAVTESFFHPSVLVIMFLIMIFLFAALCHPLEMFCLPSGALYLLCIPSGYLLLVIYSLCNLHVVSWGTREVAKKKTRAEIEQDEIENKQKEEEKSKKKGFFSKFFFSSYMTDLKEILQSAIGHKNSTNDNDRSIQLLEEINENIKRLAAISNPGQTPPTLTLEGVKVEPTPEPPKEKKKKSVKIAKHTQDIPEQAPAKPERDELKNPKWLEDKGLGNGQIMELYEEELEFWLSFVKRYLKPLDADKKKEEEVQKGLLELRTNVVFAVSMINLLWIAINFMFQYTVPITVIIPLDGGVKVDILGLLFLIFLLAILMLQIVGMVIHRWGTLLHLLAFTDAPLPFCNSKKKDMQTEKEADFRKAFDFCKAMITDPPPDYGFDDCEGDNRKNDESIRERLRATTLGTQQIGRQSVVAQLRSDGIVPSGTAFLNSPSVDMYLRGTQRARVPDEDDIDADARRFVDDFRSGVTFRNRHRQSQNGYAGSGSGSTGRVDGYAPSLPRRQNSGGNNGFRRRLNTDNFRQTVRDVIGRANLQGIEVKPEDNGGWGGGGGLTGGGGGGGGGYGAYPGQMDRVFNRQIRHFNEHASAHGRFASSRGVERERASRYRQSYQNDTSPV
ncbi:uncharacterized protein [Littorina saxatilis]|uniref:uncharacterized protein n=1 Tax=Littorina saxatilis TaxID=31220 RepID=UPI0038B57156